MAFSNGQERTPQEVLIYLTQLPYRGVDQLVRIFEKHVLSDKREVPHVGAGVPANLVVGMFHIPQAGLYHMHLRETGPLQRVRRAVVLNVLSERMHRMISEGGYESSGADILSIVANKNQGIPLLEASRPIPTNAPLLHWMGNFMQTTFKEYKVLSDR